MADQHIPLNLLPIGKQGSVTRLICEGIVRRRMMDLGLVLGTAVKALLKSPAGDPVAYEIRGAVIALRSEEAGTIIVQPS